MSIAAVAFDLDDTLYPHERFVLGAYADVADAAAEEYGVEREGFWEEIVADWRRRTSRCTSIFKDALTARGVNDPGAEGRLVGVYREHAPRLAPHPGVRRGLKALSEMGVRLGLLSDGQSGVQRRKLAALGLEEAFDAVVVTGDLGRRFYKPAPEGFLELARRMEVPAEHIVYVGDNPRVDFPGARRAGMTAVRVVGGEYAGEGHAEGDVARVFSSVAEAMDWLIETVAGEGACGK